ncbi:MAG: hypothetical protein CL785_05475 [Chloroflexi bacterium]|nr:hypothetical protein [Chloroflexota bacterium]|tara:strand:- start:136 stop:927 length:792 start_codon:yes stop_codon:yes gene_type:complete
MGWKDTEQKAVDFIKNKIKNNNIEIIPKGGSNSNDPDILIYKNNKFLFNVEIKENISQIGQFTILKKDNYYAFGETRVTDSKNKILHHINSNFDYYNHIDSAGTNVKCNIELMYEYLLEELTIKNIKYLITPDQNNTFIIISINNFKKFFDISGLIRTKKSGSRKVPKKDSFVLLEKIRKHFGAKSIKFDETILFTSDQKNVLGSTFIFNDKTFYVSKDKKDSFYKLRVLSQTNNPTVIFSMKYNYLNLTNVDTDIFLDELNL